MKRPCCLPMWPYLKPKQPGEIQVELAYSSPKSPNPIHPPNLEFHGSLAGQVRLVTRECDDDVGAGLPL